MSKIVHSRKEDQRPAMPFYYKDWLTDDGLTLCSLAARGLWIEMIIIMWKANPRGFLKAQGKQIQSRQLAKLARADMWGDEPSERITDRLLKELEDNEVFERAEDGTIYSPNMLRIAEAEREYREMKSRAGKMGGRPKKEKVERKQKESIRKAQGKAERKPSLALSFASSLSFAPSNASSEEIQTALFEHIWEKYPNTDGKKEARKHFNASVTNEKNWQDINQALENYKQHLRLNTWKHPKNGSTWFYNWHDWVNPKEEVGNGDAEAKLRDRLADEEAEKSKRQMEQAKKEAEENPITPEHSKQLHDVMAKIGGK